MSIFENLLFNPNKYLRHSYSQYGEDLVVEYYANCFKNAKFIDIGAYHPFRFSNTYKLYKKGWSGVNLEPNMKYSHLFAKHRKRDCNLFFGISNKKQELNYYKYDEPLLNTFDPLMVQFIKQSYGLDFISKDKIRLITFDDVEKMISFSFSEVQYINIDAEGYDFLILKSFNFSKYLPKIISIESIDEFKKGSYKQIDITEFLKSYDYKLKSRSVLTNIYVHD